MSNLKLKLFAVFSLMLLSLTISSAVAQSQYNGAITTNVTVGTDGTATVVDSFGVTYNIQAAAGSTGTLTTDFRSGNPYPAANVPSGVTLTRFIVITFNMNAAAFTQAQITIPYTSSDLQGIQSPYSIFKYNPITNTYTELASTTDANAKTFTVTVTGIDDPTFAIGGATALSNMGGFSTTAWVALIASIIIIILLVVVGFWYFRKHPN